MPKATGLEVVCKSSQSKQICCLVESFGSRIFFDITRHDAYELALMLEQFNIVSKKIQSVCFSSRQNCDYTVSFATDSVVNRIAGVDGFVKIDNRSASNVKLNPMYLSGRLSFQMYDKIMYILSKNRFVSKGMEVVEQIRLRCSKKDPVDSMVGAKKRTDDNLRKVFG